VFAECHLYGQRRKICSVLAGRHLIEWRTGGACATRAGFFSPIFFPETEALFLRIFPFSKRFRWWCVLVRRLLFNSCFAWFRLYPLEDQPPVHLFNTTFTYSYLNRCACIKFTSAWRQSSFESPPINIDFYPSPLTAT